MHPVIGSQLDFLEFVILSHRDRRLLVQVVLDGYRFFRGVV